MPTISTLPAPALETLALAIRMPTRSVPVDASAKEPPWPTMRIEPVPPAAMLERIDTPYWLSAVLPPAPAIEILPPVVVIVPSKTLTPLKAPAVAPNDTFVLAKGVAHVSTLPLMRMSPAPEERLAPTETFLVDCSVRAPPFVAIAALTVIVSPATIETPSAPVVLEMAPLTLISPAAVSVNVAAPPAVFAIAVPTVMLPLWRPSLPVVTSTDVPALRAATIVATLMVAVFAVGVNTSDVPDT